MNAPTLYDRLLYAVPALLALMLLVLSAIPLSWQYGPLTPHVVWLCTLTIGALVPASWPVAFAFAAGLLADMLYDTPLGAQALLSLFLTLYVQHPLRRNAHQLFPMRWAEAALLLMLGHLLLWVLTGIIFPQRPPLRGVLIGAGVSVLWFPVFYAASRQLSKLLPARS